MSCRTALLVALLLPLIYGCHGIRDTSYREDHNPEGHDPQDRGREHPHHRVYEVRAVETLTIPRDNLRVLRETKVSTKPDQFKVIRVFFRASDLHNFDLLLGPESEGVMNESSGAFALNYGWVYAFGYWPRISNSDVTAGAVGSAIAMQVFKTGSEAGLRRVFFFSGTSAQVDVTGNPSVFWNDNKQYVDIPKGAAAQKLDLSSAAVNVRTDHDNIQSEGAAALSYKK